MKDRALTRVAWLGLGGLTGALAALRGFPRRPEIPEPAAFAMLEALLARRQRALPAALLMGRIHARYRALYTDRPRFASPALRRHLERNILPALAAYQVLREEMADEEAALAVVESVINDMVLAGPYRLYYGFFRLPFAFRALKWLTPRVMARDFPAAGWDVRWAAPAPGRVAFDVHRCFYLDVLRHYGAPELTRAFCQGDDVLFAAFPSHLAWERRQTLGRGDDICDFCWRDLRASAREPILVNGDRPTPIRPVRPPPE